MGPDGVQRVNAANMEVTTTPGAYAYYYDCDGVGDHVYTIVVTDADGNTSVSRGIIEVV